MVEFCPECGNLLRERLEAGTKILYCMCGYKKVMEEKNQKKEKKSPTKSNSLESFRDYLLTSPTISLEDLRGICEQENIELSSGLEKSDIIQKVIEKLQDFRKIAFAVMNYFSWKRGEKIPSLKARATRYIRENGFEIIQKIFEQSVWTSYNLREQFTKYQYFAEKLVSLGILNEKRDNQINSSNAYKINPSVKENFLKLVNLKKISDYNVDYKIKEILSCEGYKYLLDFLYSSNSYEKQKFIDLVLKLCECYSTRLDLWEDINSLPGLTLYYLKIKYYFDLIVNDNIELTQNVSYQMNSSRKLEEFLNYYKPIVEKEEYRILKNHFQKCSRNKCDKCGGNILNIMTQQIENVRQMTLKKLEKELVRLKQIVLSRDINQINSFQQDINKREKITIKNLSKDYGLMWPKKPTLANLKPFIAVVIEHFFQNLIILHIKVTIILKQQYISQKEEYASNKVEFRKIFGNNLEIYKSYALKYQKLITPLTNIDPLVAEIIKPFKVQEAVFKNHDISTKKIGIEGERRVYLGLKKKYEHRTNIQTIWNYEKGLLNKPYDILICEDGKEKEYIEVKSSHSNEKILTMSQNEINFAKEHKDNYKLILITNLGNDINTEYEIIENVYAKIENNKLNTISIKFSL